MALRTRWYGRYITTQSSFETEIRNLLSQGALEAQRRINALDKKTTFSSGVRTAQLRMAKSETQIVLKEVFNGTGNIITRGSKAQAKSAVEASQTQTADIYYQSLVNLDRLMHTLEAKKPAQCFKSSTPLIESPNPANRCHLVSIKQKP